MFETPSAKRVKRSKLFSSFSSPADSEQEDDQKANQKSSSNDHMSKGNPPKSQKIMTKSTDDTEESQPKVDYGFEYDFIDPVQISVQGDSSLPAPPPPTSDDRATSENQAQTQGEKTYEFLLFKPKTATSQLKAKEQSNLSQAPAKITIRSPTPELPSSNNNQQGSILCPRPLSHYLTSTLPFPLLKTKRSQYLSTAISGSEIHLLSQTPWPGTHLPWRTIHIKIPIQTTISTSDSKLTNTNTHTHPRPRPSKARRLHLRRRQSERKSLLESAKQAELADREKRTRRNREKKVKRKEREKRKKIAIDGGGDNSDDGDEDGDGDGKVGVEKMEA